MLSKRILSWDKKKTLLLIFAIAILARLAAALYLGDTVPIGKDENSYSTLGARLAHPDEELIDKPLGIGRRVPAVGHAARKC